MKKLIIICVFALTLGVIVDTVGAVPYFSLNVSNPNPGVGETTEVEIYVNDIPDNDLDIFDICLKYYPSVIDVVSMQINDDSVGGCLPSFFSIVHDYNRCIRLGAGSLPGTTCPIQNPQLLATVVLQALNTNYSDICASVECKAGDYGGCSHDFQGFIETEAGQYSSGSEITSGCSVIGQWIDSDDDGIGDIVDSCPYDANPDQEDSDIDGLGDICDDCPNDPENDIDDDTICGNSDNCPDASNPNQEDVDEDGIGDVCDNCPDNANPNQEDSDTDGPGDVCDNCPSDYNPSQEDVDADGMGDVCDPDIDNDGICNQGDSDPSCTGSDNCSYDFNPNQEDVGDSDGVGDICDNCPNASNPNQEDVDEDGMGDVCDECTDTDGDGYGNPGFPNNTCDEDNCPDTPNGPNLGTCIYYWGATGTCTTDDDCGSSASCSMNQENADEDGIGDACECHADYDNDGYVYPSDLSIFLIEYGRTDCLSHPPCEADIDGDGNVYPSDLSVFLAEYGNTDCPVIP